MSKLFTQHVMSAEEYRIRRLDQNTEIIAAPSAEVEPFPTRSWNEPLPIAVEGHPLPKHEPEKGEVKSLNRFYPPLLLCSTLLTGVFFYLYLTKPVIVDNPVASSEVASLADSNLAVADPKAAPVIVQELSPFPEAIMLDANALPGLEELKPLRKEAPVLQHTMLGVEQIVEVESLNGEMEKLTVSLPVLYPENMRSWDEASVLEAQELAVDMELHLERVREVQADGVELLEKWSQIISKSTPSSVLLSNEGLGQNN